MVETVKCEIAYSTLFAVSVIQYVDFYAHGDLDMMEVRVHVILK